MSNFQEKIKQVPDFTFEQAFNELEQVVNRLESGKESLEYLMEAFEYGNALKERCEKILNESKLKIEKLVKKNAEDFETVPFEDQ